MSNKLNANANIGKVMTKVPPEILDDKAIASLIAQSIGNEMNIFQSSGIEAGTADSPLKALDKLETNDILRQILHINIVHISRATAADGEIVDKSDYPVVCFDEYPGYRYSGGKRLMQLVMTWARALGDEFKIADKGDKKGFEFEGDRLLPKLNDYISQGNRPCVLFKIEKGKNYTDVYVLGI